MCEVCECAHLPDYGACSEFEAGMNGRCVYCDHAEACHPGKGSLANGPLWPIEIEHDENEEMVDGNQHRH
jgi:hypothetical protein